MVRRRVIIELLPHGIALRAYRGSRCTGCHALAIDLPRDGAEWAERVLAAGQTLRSAVRQMELNGCSAIVVYRSPTQAVDLIGIRGVSAAQAVEAAKLSVAESIAHSAVVCDAAAIGRDAAGKSRRMHCVAAAEREEILEAIEQMVETSGLAFRSAIPLDAAVHGWLAAEALRNPGSNRARLYIGPYASFFCVAHGGALLFNRAIELGLESLVGALIRPIYPTDGGKPIELDGQTARDLLHRYGIPDANQSIPEVPGVDGRHLISLLQPVLQRCLVELRQSIRFSVAEDQRGKLSIRIAGPGAVIPGLAELFGRELDIPAERDPAWRDPSPTAPQPITERIMELGGESWLFDRINLLPRATARRRSQRRVRRWLWAGTAATVAMIAADAVGVHARLDEARRRAEAHSIQIAARQELDKTWSRLAAVVQGMDDLEMRIEQAIGSGVDHEACLREISRLTPRSIRLTALRFDRTGQTQVVAFTGLAFDGDSRPARVELERFLAQLNRSPLFESVTVNNVRGVVVGAQRGQRFEVGLHAVPTLRPRLAAFPAAGTGEGGAP